jgi:hypothetical protein
MLKIIARTFLFLIIAGLVSGALYVFAKSNTGQVMLGVAATAPASQGSGAATVGSSSSSQDSNSQEPSTLSDVLQKLGIVLEYTVVVVFLQTILSIFLKKSNKSKTFETEE